MKASWMLIAGGLIGLRLALGAIGGAEATQFLAGNATDTPTLLLGMGYVAAHLLAITLAPVLLLATALDRVLSGERP